MPAGEQADRQAVDSVALADNDAPQLVAQASIHVPELVDRLHVVFAEVHERFISTGDGKGFHHIVIMRWIADEGHKGTGPLILGVLSPFSPTLSRAGS